MAIVGRFGRAGAVRSAFPDDVDGFLGVGVFVYVVSNPTGHLEHVRRADPTNYNKLPAVGVVIYRDNDACRVQWEGETPDIFEDLSPGEIYFLGTDSRIADRPPLPTTESDMFVQPVAVAVSNTRAFIKIDNSLTKRVQLTE